MERYHVVMEQDGVVAVPAELLVHMGVREGDDVKLESIDGAIVIRCDDAIAPLSSK